MSDVENAPMAGTEPDFYLFRRATSQQEIRAAMQETHEEHKGLGATWIRYTLSDGGVWCEGWKVRPDVEAPFNPPRTAEPPATP